MSEENSSEIKECPFCAQKLDIRTKLPGSDRSCFNGVGETAKYGRAGFNAELNSVSQAAHVTRNRASNVSSVVFWGGSIGYTQFPYWWISREGLGAMIARHFPKMKSCNYGYYFLVSNHRSRRSYKRCRWHQFSISHS